MSQGVRIQDVESNWRKFDRISSISLQTLLAILLALLFTTVIPALGFVSFVKLVAELLSN